MGYSHGRMRKGKSSCEKIGHCFWFRVQGTWYARIKLASIIVVGISFEICSWTPDEDFSLLLDALRKYDGTTRKMSKKLPKILVVITGKGPQKEMYLERIRSIHWENVLILTAWLQPEDYPKANAKWKLTKHYKISALVLCRPWRLSSHIYNRLASFFDKFFNFTWYKFRTRPSNEGSVPPARA